MAYMILEAETCSEENRWNYKWSLALDSREKSQISDHKRVASHLHGRFSIPLAKRNSTRINPHGCGLLRSIGECDFEKKPARDNPVWCLSSKTLMS